jgi:ribosomal protein S18 acetylase RimI-like enzyme
MISIRMAVSSDAETIINLDPLSRIDPRRTPFIIRSINSTQCYVIECTDEVVGYGVLEYSLYDCGFVAMLYIHPEYRRKGLASELMKYFEALCKTEKLFTSTNESNTPMQALLARIGYRRSGVIENLDERDPELVYFKRLNRKAVSS